MPNVRLPDDPSLEHLRKLARRLQRAVRSGDPAALELVARRHPDGAVPDFPLSAAQLVLARECGFPSWPRLRAHLDRIGALRRDPDAVPAAADPADELCRLACLTYSSEDGPDRWAAAGRLLAEHPDLPARSVWAAAAATDPDAVAAHLAAEPGSAGREGGPYGWPPLLYLAYSRLSTTEQRTLRTARLLLDAGADPDAGYLWHGLVSPFTALTGAFGEGEQGPRRQPRHPAWLQLATLLLEAGADPNDGQTLYNRMFRPDDDFLVLLFRYGLGSGGSGVWRERLGGAADTPAEMLARLLGWAAGDGFVDRVRLLLEHGVDPGMGGPEGPPADLAAAGGHREIVDLLVAAGAAAAPSTGADAVAAAVLAGDEARVDPALLAATRASHPDLVRRAAQSGRTAAVQLAVRLGFAVDAGERSTGLHEAAWNGNLAMARLLVRLGADPDARDAAFGATPLGWAEHAYQDELVAFLRPLTTPEPAPGPSAG